MTKKKIVFICSTSGSVISRVLPYLRKAKFSYVDFIIISDRDCGVIQVAKENGIKYKIFESSSGREFSNMITEFFQNQKIDLFISFYTRLLAEPFISFYEGKIVNFHPSLLPACPGLDGFGDTIKSGSKFIGSTVHLVEHSADTGLPIIQAVFPYNPAKSIVSNRHVIFIQQCKMLIQLIEWVCEDRLVDSNVKDVNYNPEEFAPNLDSTLALEFSYVGECQ